MSKTKSSCIINWLQIVILTASFAYTSSAFASADIESFDDLMTKFRTSNSSILREGFAETISEKYPDQAKKNIDVFMFTFEKENSPLYASKLAKIIFKIDSQKASDLVSKLEHRINYEVGNDDKDKAMLQSATEYIKKNAATSVDDGCYGISASTSPGSTPNSSIRSAS